MSGCSPRTPTSRAASSPHFQMMSDTSFSDLPTISSMRAGCILPSDTRLVTARRAISLRTGSKQESVTASGVSSMMRSTPVAFSIARILRPSRPIRRPFMSSLGSCTVVTVASETTSAANL